MLRNFLRNHSVRSAPPSEQFLPPVPTLSDWQILQEGNNPSTDYYIKPELVRLGRTYSVAELSTSPPRLESRNLVIVRYLSDMWARWIHANRRHYSEIVFFMDDDLLNPESWTELPQSYRKKLAANHALLRRWLPKISPDFWVSTTSLERVNPSLQATVIPPRPLAGDELLNRRAPDPSREHLIFYHATASHLEEFRWIKPVMEHVLHANSQARFEVIGDLTINRLFRDLPRTCVIHPMKWDSYLNYTRTVSGGLGLAPLLPNPFNSGRSVVKQFDIDRMAAQGLYGAGSPYAANLQPGRGRLAVHDHGAWISEIEGWLHRP